MLCVQASVPVLCVMCVCACMCMHVCLRRVCVFMCVFMCACVCSCVHVRVHVCVWCMCACVCVVCVYMCVCIVCVVCVFMCVCMCVHGDVLQNYYHHWSWDINLDVMLLHVYMPMTCLCIANDWPKHKQLFIAGDCVHTLNATQPFSFRYLAVD